MMLLVEVQKCGWIVADESLSYFSLAISLISILGIITILCLISNFEMMIMISYWYLPDHRILLCCITQNTQTRKKFTKIHFRNWSHRGSNSGSIFKAHTASRWALGVVKINQNFGLVVVWTSAWGDGVKA